MYRVMIIDDEQSIRKILRTTIDWDKHSMEVVGEAASGIEAINTIDDIRPDLCFVDIRMPFMDGLEFSRLATRRYPNMKIVVLTAYEEFDYARECIQIGVEGYLIKPIVKKDIIDTLERIESDLNERVMEPDNTADMEASDADSSQSSMERIRQYVEDNYQEPDLNLAKAAMEYGFNTSYLSRKFKQETGGNFVDYLFELRMQKAKQLANTDKAMYQVANEVGIPDPNYFGKCFKRYEGETYSEYRQKNTKRD